MQTTIAPHLSGLTLGEGQRHDNLSVFPLLAAGEAGARAPGYLLLEAALAQGLVQVTEVSQGGAVPTLTLVSRATRPVLVLAGEELRGAKQNRIVNVSILVAPGATLPLPVACVEQGRWRYDRPDFAAGAGLFNARGRARHTADVSASVRASGEHHADQGAVWDEVERKQRAMHVSSPTMAFADVREQARGGVEAYTTALRPLPGQVGALVAIDGRIAGLDAFDATATWAALHDKIVASYALDALETVRRGTRYHRPTRAAHAFWTALAGAPVAVGPGLSLGQDWRLEAPGLVGAALVHEGALVHLSAFPTQAAPFKGPRTRLHRGRRLHEIVY